MLASNGSHEPGGSVATEDARGNKQKTEKAERVELSFKEMATRSVARARRALPEEEADKAATSEQMMQSAIVYAILDLADAVRSNPQALNAAPGE
jgi:hypothetical protein